MPTSIIATSALKNYTVAADVSLNYTLGRITPSINTISLMDQATDSTQRIVTGKTGWISLIQTNVAARVRVYSTDAARTTDLARGIGIMPTSGSGVIAEAITTPSGLSIVMTPMASFANMEIPPVGNLPITVTNLSGGTTVVTVTFAVTQFES